MPQCSVLEASAISIHAPREGCDAQDYRAFVAEFLISIHAPREGCDSKLY